MATKNEWNVNMLRKKKCMTQIVGQNHLMNNSSRECRKSVAEVIKNKIGYIMIEDMQKNWVTSLTRPFSCFTILRNLNWTISPTMVINNPMIRYIIPLKISSTGWKYRSISDTRNKEWFPWKMFSFERITRSVSKYGW